MEEAIKISRCKDKKFVYKGNDLCQKGRKTRASECKA